MDQTTCKVFELRCGDLCKDIPSTQAEYWRVNQCLPVENTDEKEWIIVSPDGGWRIRGRDSLVRVIRRKRRLKTPSGFKFVRLKSVRRLDGEPRRYRFISVNKGTFTTPEKETLTYEVETEFDSNAGAETQPDREQVQE